MSSQRVFRYAFSSVGKYPTTGEWSHVSEADFHTSLRRIGQAVLAAEVTPAWADDLLRIARAVYLVDKRAPRPRGLDPWTRDLHLWVHVTDADRWRGEPITVLETVLRAMTSDQWHLTIEGGAPPIDVQPRLGTDSPAGEVALFSGGLDSTAYAAQQASTPGHPVLLIGHDLADGHIPQKALYEAIRRLSGGQRTITYCPVGDSPATPSGYSEPSTRTRGFLFAATAIYAAAAHGTTVATMPENGQLAINPPLTAARRAACSTRSVHPWVLDLLNHLTTAVHGDVSLHNPFLYKTKGEVCAIARDSGLSANSLGATVSCGTYSVHRQDGNCGFCYPCLIRRSGLQAALGHDPTHYSRALSELTTIKTAQHVLDLQQWLLSDFGARELVADMPLPRSADRPSLLAMLTRGRAEIVQMLAHHHQWSPVPETGAVAEAVER